MTSLLVVLFLSNNTTIFVKQHDFKQNNCELSPAPKPKLALVTRGLLGLKPRVDVSVDVLPRVPTNPSS